MISTVIGRERLARESEKSDTELKHSETILLEVANRYKTFEAVSGRYSGLPLTLTFTEFLQAFHRIFYE
jgi:hypothetical protein